MAFWMAAAALSGLSIAGGAKATSAQKKAQRTQMEINRLKNEQQKRKFMRNFRQQMGINLSAGIASGVGLESSRIGATASSQQAQARLGLKEFQKFDRLGAEVVSQQNKAADAAFASQAFGSLASFSSNFIDFTK